MMEQSRRSDRLWAALIGFGGAFVGAASAVGLWYLNVCAERRAIITAICIDIPHEVSFLNEIRNDSESLVIAMQSGPNARYQDAYNTTLGYRAARLGNTRTLADDFGPRLGTLNSKTASAVHSFYAASREVRWRFDGMLDLVDGTPNKQLEINAAKRFITALAVSEKYAASSMKALRCKTAELP